MSNAPLLQSHVDPARRRAIAPLPSRSRTHFNIGVIRFGRGEIEEALASFRMAVAHDPHHADAHNNLGAALASLKRCDEAAESFQRAITLQPRHAGAFRNLASTHLQGQRWDEAAICSSRANELDPDNAETLCTLGMAMRRTGRLDDAEAHLRRSLAIQPGRAGALVTLGNVLVARRRLAQGEACFREAIERDPACALARVNLGRLHLLRGEFADGWREYEWRWKVQNSPLLARRCPQRQWDGSDIAGRTILLHAEQGFGDTLQFIRYVLPVAARGARVVVEVPAATQRLFMQSPLIAGHEIIAQGQPAPPFNVHCPLLSAPLAMQTELASIPASVPYLQADSVDIAAWRSLLAADTATLKVGVAWAGNRRHLNDRNRSLPPGALASLFEAMDDSVSFYSLQTCHMPEDIKAQQSYTRLRPLPRGLRDFADTAALMANLDLIISVDTAVVHLAGAIGRPVWTLLPFDPDWRWLLDRADSPWYPTMRLFRQSRHRDWASVVADVATALAALSHAE